MKNHAFIRGKLARSERLHQSNPGAMKEDAVSEIKEAQAVMVNEILLRRFYGAWRPLRVLRTESYMLGDTKRIVFTVKGVGGSDETPFALPAMNADAMVKISNSAEG